MIKIDPDKCNHCGLCQKICISEAIFPEINTIDKDKCTSCTQCLAICPVNAISYDEMNAIPLEESFITPESFKNLILKRRSHRNYTDTEIPEAIISKICSLLKYAPTGTNTQQVYLTVLNTAEKVKNFSDQMTRFFLKLSKIFLNPFFLPILFLIIGKYKTLKVYHMKKQLLKYYDGIDILAYNAPSLILFHAPKESSTPEQDCVIWSTTAMYYAETMGLGSCLNGFIVHGLNLNKKLKHSLGIPRDHKIYSSLLLGYPKYQFKNSVIREETKVNYIKP